MSYDPEFYEKYDAYLAEPRVRVVHDRVFRMWEGFVNIPGCRNVVLDLGCGRAQEYKGRVRAPTTMEYFGFDVNAENSLRQLDYRDPRFMAVAQGVDPSLLVSLFSTELTAGPRTNRRLYETLFKECPKLAHALVAGMYYKSKKGQTIVIEKIPGGNELESQQFIYDFEDMDVVSDVYRDTRITVDCPSTLFGEDVVEVWRILSRRQA